MLWLILSIVVVASSPIGRALADRMAGRVPPSDDDEILHEFEDRMEERIAELEDRLEMTERLLDRPPGDYGDDRTIAG